MVFRRAAKTIKPIASALQAPERIMLFCVGSGTDWHVAGVTDAMTRHLLFRGLITPDQSAGRFRLTPLGRDVLAELLKQPGKQN
jgi:hypothetical protein